MRWKWTKPDPPREYTQPHSRTYTPFVFVHIHGHSHVNSCTDKSFSDMLWYNISFTLKLNAHRPSSARRHRTMAHRSLVCIPSGLAVCVCARLCLMFIHSFRNFPTSHCACTAGSWFFPYSSRFMHVCPRDVLSLHVPSCARLFLCSTFGYR